MGQIGKINRNGLSAALIDDASKTEYSATNQSSINGLRSAVIDEANPDIPFIPINDVSMALDRP